jgi:hypothetical protein
MNALGMAASSPKLALQRGSARDALFNNGIVKGNLYRRYPFRPAALIVIVIAAAIRNGRR